MQKIKSCEDGYPSCRKAEAIGEFCVGKCESSMHVHYFKKPEDVIGKTFEAGDTLMIPIISTPMNYSSIDIEEVKLMLERFSVACRQHKHHPIEDFSSYDNLINYIQERI